MQNKNFLKLSLYECKLDKNSQLSDYGNFKLSISFNNKNFVTDKININHTKFKSGKFFYFEIPQIIDDNQNLSISAIGTSWMFFNSVICSCEINYKKNLSNFNDKKYWYPLKNKDNKEIMQILISIWTEYSILDSSSDPAYGQSSKLADISLFNDKSSFINHSSLCNVTNLTQKNEPKQQKLNNTTMIRTQRDENKSNNTNTNISSKGLLKHLYKETNPSSLCQDNININKTTNNIIFNTLSNINTKNTKNKNNNIIKNINNNNIVRGNCALSSPFIAKDNISGLLTGNNLSYINHKNDDDLDNNIIEYDHIIALIEKYEKEGGDKNNVKKLWEQINSLKEKEANLEKQQMKYNEALCKLNEKNKILNKERQQLDYKISKFKKEQSEYEQKNMNLTQYILNYENNMNKFNTQKNIDKNNKEIFLNLNYYISTGYNIPLNNDDENNDENDGTNNNQILLNSTNDLLDSLNIDKIS